MEKLCRFSGTGNYCQILVDVRCCGSDELCKFRKTDKQFREERNKAILINRKKHNCNSCRYMKTPCRLD
ncbi:MAG: hypothetical protein K2J08_02115 [Ruminococcus sp.]|nr:hypothetical protein [Ruminococcus sp.]